MAPVEPPAKPGASRSRELHGYLQQRAGKHAPDEALDVSGRRNTASTITPLNIAPVKAGSVKRFNA